MAHTFLDRDPTPPLHYTSKNKYKNKIEINVSMICSKKEISVVGVSHYNEEIIFWWLMKNKIKLLLINRAIRQAHIKLLSLTLLSPIKKDILEGRGEEWEKNINKQFL